MTFIFGYIYDKAVHLVADSVETILIEGTFDGLLPEEFSSTMIESSVAKDGQLMTESANKIYNIQEKLLIGFAGEVYEGLGIIREIVNGLVTTEDMRDYISSVFDKEKPKKTQYIIAFIEDGLPCMFCYHNPHEELKAAGNLSLCSIGKNHWLPSEIVVSMLKSASDNCTTQDDLLITAISTLQMTTLGLRTLEQGVGGYINGAYITSAGVHWAKDTVYLLYASLHLDKPETTYLVAKYNRDNAVFIRSGEKQKMFVALPSTLSAADLDAKWGNNLRDLANSGVADYYILLSYDKHIIFLINNKINNSCKVFVKNGIFTFSPDLVKANTKYHDTRDEYKFAFILVSNFPLKKDAIYNQ